MLIIEKSKKIDNQKSDLLILKERIYTFMKISSKAKFDNPNQYSKISDKRRFRHDLSFMNSW